MRRVAIWSLWGFAGVLAIIVGIAFALTQTDYGRERVRLILLGQVASIVDGTVEIERIRGNLLTGAALEGVKISDTTGVPFLTARRVFVDYAMLSLVLRRILISALELDEPVITLDRPPGQDWNFVRLFPSDTSATETPADGFGSWIRIENLSIRDGTVILRDEWRPDSTLSLAAQDRAVRTALRPESRLTVVEVPGGYQTVQEVRDLHAELPLLRLADPNDPDIVVEIGSLRARALVFRPPPAYIRDLAGRVVVSSDSLRVEDLRLDLPDSRVAGSATFLPETGAFHAMLDAAPISFADLRWASPSLPDGGGNLRLEVSGEPGRIQLLAPAIDVQMEGARLSGHLEAELGDTVRIGNTDLAFSGVDTRILEPFVGEGGMPADGVLEGRLRLAGRPESLDIDGWTTFRERSGVTSRIAIGGRAGTAGTAVVADGLSVRLEPVHLSIVRPFLPDIELEGALTGGALVTGSTASGFDIVADLVHDGPSTGTSRLAARGGVTPGERPGVQNLVIDARPIQLALARSFVPDLALKGALTGEATLNGDPSGLRVDADLTLAQPGEAASRIGVEGTLVLEDGFATPGLLLRFDPLQSALARTFAPDLPIGGRLDGEVLVSGSNTSRLGAEFGVEHRDVTGDTRLVGQASVTFADPLGLDVDIRAPEVSFATVGRFAPAAGLHGTGRASARIEGTLRDLDVAVDFAIDDGGAASLAGSVGVEGDIPSYSLQAELSALELDALSSSAPPATWSGTIRVVGAGTDPATARATIQADLSEIMVAPQDGAPETFEAVTLSATIADGLVAVDRGSALIASAAAELSGSFGLTPDRVGTLRYRLAVDSLADFSALLAPVPAADSAVADSASPVVTPDATPPDPALAAASQPVVPADPADPTTGLALATAEPPVAAMAADSVAGSVLLEGAFSGNLERFVVEGTAAVDNLVLGQNAVRVGSATYSLAGPPSAGAEIFLEAHVGDARVAALALDSLVIRAEHAGDQREGAGSVRVHVFQDETSDYRVGAEYQLSLDRSELRLDETELRFDSTYWRTSAPGFVRWGGDGVEIERFEMTDGRGGRIFADGRLPRDGDLRLDLEVDRLAIGHVATMLQDTSGVRGLLDARLALGGTRSAPRLDGSASLDRAGIGEIPLPSARMTFDYAESQLTASATIDQDGTTLAVLDARLPVNLAFADYEGPRLLDLPLAVEVRADSLPLDALPSVTPAVSDVEGIVRGNVSVSGTWTDPEAHGDIALDLGSVRIVEPGVTLRDLNGRLRIRADSIVLDSLVARSRGTIRMAGSVDIATPSEPGFDLTLQARGAEVLNNDMGIARVDADLALAGPFEMVRVSGEVNVREGTLYIPESRPRLIRLEDPAFEEVIARIDPDGTVLPEPSPLLRNLTVAVDLRISRNTWVRNADASVEIYTPDESSLTILLDNQLNALTLEGTVNADRGEYSFSGRRFQLTSGSVTFLGEAEFDPRLQLVATHQAPQPNREPLTIQIGIGGYLSNPTLTLSSNAQPPLPESDLISYLAFGQPSNSLLQPGGTGLSGGGGATELGTLATQQLAAVALGALVEDAVSNLERSAGRAGLDVLRISPADDLPVETVLGGSVRNILRGTEIEAGKYIGSRMFVSAQGRPNVESAPGMAMEYRTPDGFVVRVTWQPHYLPSEPTLVTETAVDPTRVFGVFLNWRRRF